MSLAKLWGRNLAARSRLVGSPPMTVVKKPKTDGRVGLAIKKVDKENPFLPARNYQTAVSAHLGEGSDMPSTSTINRFLMTNQMVVIELKRKQFISNANILKRFDFASRSLENLDSLMYRTIWSDETTVRKHPKAQHLFFRCHQSTPKGELPYNHQLLMGGFNVMFWVVSAISISDLS
jgi:hypothetical protein